MIRRRVNTRADTHLVFGIADTQKRRGAALIRSTGTLKCAEALISSTGTLIRAEALILRRPGALIRRRVNTRVDTRKS